MTLAVPPSTHESVYGSPVADHDRELEEARTQVTLEKRAHAAHRAALDARDDAVRAYHAAARGTVSDNELARRLGLNSSTFRSIINRAPRTRRET